MSMFVKNHPDGGYGIMSENKEPLPENEQFFDLLQAVAVAQQNSDDGSVIIDDDLLGEY